MYTHMSQGVRFQDEPRDWPGATFKLDQAVMVLRSNRVWTPGRVAFVHHLGSGEFVYTVRVDLDDPGPPKLKCFIKEIRA